MQYHKALFLFQLFRFLKNILLKIWSQSIEIFVSVMVVCIYYIGTEALKIYYINTLKNNWPKGKLAYLSFYENRELFSCLFGHDIISNGH